MFDFAFSEIALIGVVALVAIGPKDMPVAIKAISDTIKKLRRMAGEFQGHVDEMIRDADLGDVKTSFDELRSFSPRALVQRTIDPDGTVRGAFADPFRDRPVLPVMQPLASTQIASLAPGGMTAGAFPPAGDAPAFIPPGATRPAPIQPAPAFIPPQVPAPDRGEPAEA